MLMASPEHSEMLACLQESLRGWIAVSSDGADLSSGISLRRSTVDMGNPPFGELRGKVSHLGVHMRRSKLSMCTIPVGS